MQIWFDPGDTTGVCIFNDEYQPIDFKQLSLEELIKFVAEWDKPLDVVGYELFRVFRQKAHTQVGSKMKVSQAVGIIKMLAHTTGAKLVEQEPNIKPIALAWSGISMPKQHSQTHQYDAFLHGYYYNRKVGNTKSERQPITKRTSSENSTDIPSSRWDTL